MQAVSKDKFKTYFIDYMKKENTLYNFILNNTPVPKGYDNLVAAVKMIKRLKKECEDSRKRYYKELMMCVQTNGSGDKFVDVFDRDLGQVVTMSRDLYEESPEYWPDEMFLRY